MVDPVKHDSYLDLLELYKRPVINNVSAFCEEIHRLKPNELVTTFHRAQKSAPKRHLHGKRYFVGHSGVINSGKNSNRREEHLAVALWNASQEGKLLALPDGSQLKLMDYQFPLKARRGDKGVGKVDLFGVIDGVRSCVIELKIDSLGSGYGDTPLRAFLEALAYCAIVEANASDIAGEALDDFGLHIIKDRPALVIMAPTDYWSAYLDHEKTGEWWPAMLKLSDQLARVLDLECHFIALRDSEFSMGLNGQKPQLTGDCSMINVASLIE